MHPSPRRRSARLVAIACLGVAGVAAALVGGVSAKTPPKKKPVVTKIAVTASDFKFRLSRTSMVPVGTVVFTVKNAGKVPHNFKIAGKVTPLIVPGKSATLTVAFKKAAKYSYLCTVPGHAAAGMLGVLGVGVKVTPGPVKPAQKPVPKPTTKSYPATTTAPATTSAAPAATTAPAAGTANTTVTVDEFEYGFKLSATTVPSGTVTFNMTNTGSIVHNFDLETVGVGPYLQPGQSATMTVTLKPGTYTYVCDVPYHADSGMEGQLVVQ